MGFQSALAAIDHVAKGSVAKSMVMAHTRASCRSASAGFHGSAQGSPPHARGEQRGNGQNGQKSIGNAHGFNLEAQGHIVPDSVWKGCIGGCLGGKGVRRGEGVFELAAKGSALHLGGSIAALAGFDAIVLIGFCEENLRELAAAPSRREWVDLIS